MALDGFFRHAQQCGDLSILQSDEEAEFHHLGLRRVFRRQTLQGLVHFQHQGVIRGDRQFNGIQVHPVQVAAMFAAAALSGAIHQNPPHYLGRDGETNQRLDRLGFPHVRLAYDGLSFEVRL